MSDTTTTTTTPRDITTLQELKDAVSDSKKCVLYFWAPWLAESAPGGSVYSLYDTLVQASAVSAKDIFFFRVNSDNAGPLAEKFQVSAVPTFVLLDENGSVVEKIQGLDAGGMAPLTQAVQALSLRGSFSHYLPTETKKDDNDETSLQARLASLIASQQVMLFMKGTPAAPKCGFSRQMVQVLQTHDIAFGSLDILQDAQVRAGLKEYSNWPTYPQLYVRGEFVGGLDIVKELVQEAPTAGTLAEQLGVDPVQTSSSSLPTTEEQEEKKTQVPETTTATRPAETTKEEDAATDNAALTARLSDLVRRSRIMLFMKGLPSAPRCGFSRQIVEMLEEVDVSFDAFDILQDNDVRQGLKTFSNWPTFPQLYVEGEFVGGLDVVKDLAESGDLEDLLLPPRATT